MLPADEQALRESERLDAKRIDVIQHSPPPHRQLCPEPRRNGRPQEDQLTHLHPELGLVRMVSSGEAGAVVSSDHGERFLTWEEMERVQKPCGECGGLLLLGEFHKSTRAKDRRISVCKGCRNAAKRSAPSEKKAEYCRRYKKRHPDKIKEAARRDRERYPERHRARQKALRESHDPKHKARHVLRNAVYHGRVNKPTHCERCGGDFEKHEIHGHHSDYSKPFDVDWVCHECHLAAHNGDFAVEAEFGPLRHPESLDGRPACELMGYGAHSTDPYEQARERYHEV